MKSWIVLGASLAALAVALGAFGAHGLKNRVNIPSILRFQQNKPVNVLMYLLAYLMQRYFIKHNNGLTLREYMAKLIAYISLSLIQI